MTRHVAALLILAVAVLVFPAPGRAGKVVTVRVPSFEVPARTNREVCVFVPVHVKKPMEIGEVMIVNQGGKSQFATHHMIIFAWTGPLAALAGSEGQVRDDTACLRLGGGSGTQLQIVATSQLPSSRQRMPRGTALTLQADTMDGKETVGLVLNSHWINGSDTAQRARVKIKLVAAKPKQVKRQLKPIFEVVANAFINLAPGQTGNVGFGWEPGDLGLAGVASFIGGAAPPAGPACVTMLSAHMHRRGTLFATQLVRKNGETTDLYSNTKYSDPPTILYDPPMYVPVGDRIAYRCTHDNATDPRLGCEEQAGVPPGRSIVDAIVGSGGFVGPTGAAKLCTAPGPDPGECPATDPAFPGHTFTGNCVPARLVFGFNSEDDMCILPGYYYDADPDAPAGQECDL